MTGLLIGRQRLALVIAGALGVVAASGCQSVPEARPPPPGWNWPPSSRQQAVDKVDILFAIDNSASMGDKQDLLAKAVPDMIDRLLTPNCLTDPNNSNSVVARVNGQCPDGSKEEFPAVYDMHIGIVTSSLGSGVPLQANGTTSCIVLVVFPQGLDQGTVCDPGKGLAQVDPSIRDPLDARRLADLQKVTPQATAADLGPVCELTQLVPGVDYVGDCANAPEPGWCYLDGAAAGGCSQRAGFSKGAVPAGTQVVLECPATDAGP